MRHATRLVLLSTFACILLAGNAAADLITGEYSEVWSVSGARDPMVIDRENLMVGDRAVIAWKVKEGTYQATRLDGLTVVAVLQADGRRASGEGLSTRTTLLVDNRADELQVVALVNMAKALAPEAIQDVRAVNLARIDLTVCVGCALGYASLDAGGVRVRTRRIANGDSIERRGRPGLAKAYYSYSAFTLELSGLGRDEYLQSVQSADRSLPRAVVGGFAL